MTTRSPLPMRKTNYEAIRAREGKKLLKQTAIVLRQLATALDRCAKQKNVEVLELESISKLNRLCQRVFLDILNAKRKTQ